MTVPPILTLGTQSLPDLIAALRDSGVCFNAYAEALLIASRLQIAREPRQVTVVVHTVGALGWPEGAPLDSVLRGAADRGFDPCPLEVALKLRLAWRTVSVSPRITIASVCTADETQPRGFYLRDDNEGCWLRAYVASDDWVMAPHERLALLR